MNKKYNIGFVSGSFTTASIILIIISMLKDNWYLSIAGVGCFIIGIMAERFYSYREYVNRKNAWFDKGGRNPPPSTDRPSGHAGPTKPQKGNIL
jgi:hypothetical protein